MRTIPIEIAIPADTLKALRGLVLAGRADSIEAALIEGAKLVIAAQGTSRDKGGNEMNEREMIQYRADFDRKMAEATKKRCQKTGCIGSLCPMAWERSAEMWERLKAVDNG